MLFSRLIFLPSKSSKSSAQKQAFKTWITRIVVNQCIMHLREPHRRRVTQSLDEVVGGTPRIVAVDSRTPEDLALRAEIESAVADAIAKLPTALLNVLTGYSVFGLSIRGTAGALGLTVQATKTHLFRSRSQLRQELRTFAGGLTPTTSRLSFRS